MLKTLGLFLDGGSIGFLKRRTHREEQRVARGAVLPQVKSVPLAVLTGQGTRGTAEMFAAGLRWHKQAPVIGLPSAGETILGAVHKLSDGSELWLSEVIYQLPDGISFEGRGIQPDHRVEGAWWQYLPADDPQIQIALTQLAR